MKHFTLILFAFLLLLSCANHIFVVCLLTPAAPVYYSTTTEPSSTLINDSNSTRTSTIKTSRSNYGRTIQRTVGGFIGVSNEVVKSESRTSTTSTTTAKPSPIYYSRNNSSRDSRVIIKPKGAPDTTKKFVDTSIKGSSSNINLAISKDLGKNVEENALDYGLMSMSATGDGKTNATDDELTGSNGNKKDESKKTLSDQIAEGKYGLIDKELFRKTPKPLGIISYLTNSETPDDNEKTLGGLDKEDIWLAEDHLLILKGGSFNKKNSYDDNDWKPIDDYEAPKRPVKIPSNPKVPPPFPVQLQENGPVQIIGHHQFSLPNPFANQPLAKNPSKAPPNGFDKTHFAPGFGPPQNATKANGYLYPSPYPPSSFPQISDVIPPWLLNETDAVKQNIPLPFPFPPPLPPNIEQILKSGNFTDEFDEDDPSLFYPPPYSFKYHSNYSNLVAPGPLVPGIILPPPPDFFQREDEPSKEKPIKTPLDVLHRINEIQLKKKLTTTDSTPTTTYRPVHRPVISKSRKPVTVTPTTKLNKIKSTYSPVTPTYIYSTTPTPIQTSTSFTETVEKVRKPNKYDTTTLRLRPIYSTTTTTTTVIPLPTTTSTIRPIIVNEIVSPTPKTVLTKVPYVQQPEIISFVPKVNKNNKIYTNEFQSNGHPIYFEYFDARGPNPTEQQYTSQPVYPVYKSTFKSSSPTTTVRPLNKKTKDFYSNTQFVSSTPAPAIVSTYEPFDYNKYVYVTPKPEIIPNGIPSSSFPTATDPPVNEEFVPIIHTQSHKTAKSPLLLKPFKSFEDEIDSIRETLNYYTRQKFVYSPELVAQRAPKAKAVYEYAFDSTKPSKQGFQAPVQYDDAPFQPILSYTQLAGDTYYTDHTGRSKKVKNSYLGTDSPPLSNNYFATQKVPIEQVVKFAKTNPNRDYYDPAVLSDLFNYHGNQQSQQQHQQQTTQHREKQAVHQQQQQHHQEVHKKPAQQQQYYQTSTESGNYYKTSQSQSTPQSVKDPNKSSSMVFGQKIKNNGQNQQKGTTKAQKQPTQSQPWVSVEKQVVKEVTDQQYRQPQTISYQQVPQRGFQGQQNYRVNNRHLNYRKNQRPQKIVSHYGEDVDYVKQHYYDSEIPSLLNDTLVNYQYPQRPINPYSEFIDITNVHPPVPPPIQHSPPNYPNHPNNNRYPVIFPGHYQRLPLQQGHPHPLQQQQQHYGHLEKDIVVNYKYPLPQINPESVSITSPSMVYNRPHNTFKRRADNEPQQPQAQQSQKKSSRVYYISPQNDQ